VSESLSARIVIDLYPHTVVGPARLLQRKRDIAKLSPPARIKELRFCVFEKMRFPFHRMESFAWWTPLFLHH
jgi:hypothetical protein